jgi:hypothetical protein
MSARPLPPPARQPDVLDLTGAALLLAALLRAGSGVQVGAGDVIAMLRATQLLALSLIGLPVVAGLQGVCRRMLASERD